MKKKFICLASFLLVFSFMLLGCNSISLSGGPHTSDVVYGNGGMAVTKGDYLYFANAFIDYNKLGINDNSYDKKNQTQQRYGIYRTKLKNGKVVLSDKGTPIGAELLVPMIGGHAYAGLYICGDYLYYTTPYSKAKDKEATGRGLMRFERVRLDGTEHEQLYSEDNYDSTCKYNMVYVDGTTYIVFSDTLKNLKVVACTSSGKSPRPIVLAENITSFGVFEQKNISSSNVVADENKFVYFSTKDDASGTYFLKKIDFKKTMNEADIIVSGQNEILVEAVKNNKVYYRNNNILYSYSNGVSKKYTNIPLKALSQQNNNSDPSQQQSGQSSESTNSIIDYVILENIGNDLDRGIVGLLFDGKNYSFVLYNNEGKVVTPISVEGQKDITKKITIVASQGNEFFYQIEEDKNLYFCQVALDFSNGVFELNNQDTTSFMVATDFELNSATAELFDCDQNSFYCFRPVEGSEVNYLTRFRISKNPKTNEEGKVLGQYVGIVK